MGETTKHETWERTRAHKMRGVNFTCYFLVREIGMTATAVAEKLGIGQPAVSIVVDRGETFVREKGLRLP